MRLTWIAAAAATLALTTPAFAGGISIIPGTSYSSSAGAGNSGTDAFGNPWTWNKTLGVGSPTPGAGYSAWGTPGLGEGTVAYGSTTPANAFAVTFIGFPVPSINTTPTAGAGYDETTRFWGDGAYWTPEYTGTNTVTFIAPTGDYLTQGEDYFVNVIFTSKSLNGSNTGFTAAFANSSAPGPVPGAGLAGLAALALAGLYARTRRA